MRRLSCVFAVILFVTASSSAQQPDLNQLKREAISEVDSLQTLTQQMVDEIFSYAELGFQEYNTSRYVSGILEKNGFTVQRGVAGIPTAWVATWGSGKPVIAFITDIDDIPQASQKPGVAYHDPIVPGAPGHGEGHNSGQAVNVTAALSLKKVMGQHHLPGTLKLFPGVAEELLGTKAFYIREGLFRDVDVVLGCHVGAAFDNHYGELGSGLASVQYFFHGKAAHAALAPWEGRSALNAVELMNAGWNFRREHLRLQQRSHYVISNGGAWPRHFNKVIAEVQHKNIEAVGMPEWSDADQILAHALQKEIGAQETDLRTKVEELHAPRENMGGVSDDIGDISWNVPTVNLFYPANIPNLTLHSWPSAVAMATPIAHKGSTAGAKVQAMTALDFVTTPALVQQAWAYFRDVQTKDIKYMPLIGPDDKPAIELNRDKMEKFLPELQKTYYDPTRYKTYLQQLGIQYPTVKK